MTVVLHRCWRLSTSELVTSASYFMPTKGIAGCNLGDYTTRARFIPVYLPSRPCWLYLWGCA